MIIHSKKELTHDMFVPEVYEWVVHAELNKWIRTETKTMDRQKFIDCLIYLIACGAPLRFNDDLSKFQRVKTFQETLSEWDAAKEMMGRVASIQSRRDTFYSKRVKYLSERNKSLKSNEINAE